jgi:hypothetical protein
LVNLTEHEIVLESQVASDDDEWGSGAPATFTLPPEGRFARVDDERASLSHGWLNATTDLVPVTRMSRSRRVVDIPAPEPGIRYVVSRVTALAAWNRGDLVFPFGEVRDGGRIVRTRGLASFRRRQALAERYRDWREAVRDRRSRKTLKSQWLTAVMFAGATALLSGAIGLFPGTLDNWRKSGWGGGGQFWTAWLMAGFGLVGVALLGLAAWRWRERGVILEARGTAYVIEEQAITWRHEEKASVLAVIGEEFAGVLRVPGPEALGENWRWQADAAGARQWDARADELVRSFWSVHFNDDQVTRNAVFTWAPWPVAMAFGARATARRRGLVLHVRQRPSYGAGGPRQHLCVTDGAHDFLRDEEFPLLQVSIPQHTVARMNEQLTLTVQALGSQNVAEGGAGADVSSGLAALDDESGLLLLVVRLIDGPVGPIPADLSKAPEVALGVSGDLAASVIPVGKHIVPTAEWRLTSAGRPAPQVPWKAFPAVAEAVADWVVEQAAAYPGRTVLLATRIPQELAVGLGIQLGQRTRTWPRQVFPVYFAAGQLMVPNLRLGAESVPAERT